MSRWGLPRALVVLVGVALAASAGSVVSGATYSSGSANRANTFKAADWAGPEVALADPGSALSKTVTLIADASDSGSGVASVQIQQSLAGQAKWTTICTRGAAPYSCPFDTTQLANDLYDLRAVATDRDGNTANSATVQDVQIDNAAPSVAVVDPGSPLSGAVTIAANATDADSAVARVTVQYSSAGAGSWHGVCSDASEPFSCRWDTATGSTPDGLYDLRAIAVDSAGNSTTSAAVTGRRVDNSVSSVSFLDPGDYLRGVVTLEASVASSSGVKSVTIERSPAGAGAWTAICTDQASPWSCAFDTAAGATPDGLYDLRARMVTGTGATVISATVANRRFDNTSVRGADVQAANRVGGTAGRIEAGDSLTLAWTDLMNPATLMPSWTGTAPITVYARLRDGSTHGTGSAADWLELWRNSGGTLTTGLGAVNLGGDYVRSNKTVIFTASASYAATTVNGVPATKVTIALISQSGGGTHTWSSGGTMSWTPAASATDLAGNPCSGAPVAELGAADRDF